MSARGTRGALVAALPVAAQPAFWPDLNDAARVRLLHTAPALHPDVVAAATSACREAQVALASRTDLDPGIYLKLAGDSALYGVLDSNPVARLLLPGARSPLPLGRALDLARRVPFPAGALPGLLAHPDPAVRPVLAGNPGLTATELRAVLTDPASGRLAAGLLSPRLLEAVLGNPAADLGLLVDVLTAAARPTPAGWTAEDLAQVVLAAADADPHRLLPALLGAGTPAAVAAAIRQLSLLTPAGQVALAGAVTAADVVADRWAAPLAAAAGLESRLADLLDGWCCRNGRTLSVAQVHDGLDGLAAELGGGPLSAEVVPGAADPEVVAGELTDTAWGRRPLHAAAAPQLPWPQLLELADQLPGQTLELLLGRVDCDRRLPELVLARHPLLLTKPGCTATRSEHVLAALAELKPPFASSAGRRNGQLRGLVRWGLPQLSVDPDAAADAAPTLAVFLDLLDDMGTDPVSVAWRSAAVSALARRLTGAVGGDQSESAWRLAGSVLGAGNAPAARLLDAATAALD